MQTIYTGGRVFTGTLPLAEAFIVADGRFCAVGTTQEMLALQQPGDAVVELGGHFVCPGFNDSHMHLVNYGNTMEMCSLIGATSSLQEVQQALRDFAAGKQLARDQWLLGRGWNHDYFTPATGIPTRWDLDEVSTELPICITRCCGHCLVVNSRALELLGIDESTSIPEGGAADKDAQGRLTGVFRDSAMPLAQSRLPSHTREDLKRMIRTGSALLNSVGVTSCQTDDFCAFESVPWQEVLEAYQELEAAGEMTVRVYEQCQFTTPDSLMSFFHLGMTTGSGTEMFRIGPLKLLGDGSLGARTAYLSGEYADAPGEKGLAIFTQEQFNELISLAHEHRMQCAIHVIGDGILDRVLNAYDAAFRRFPREDHRSGLVHVQLTRPDQLQRMQELRLHAYVQPVFLDYDSHIVRQRAGDALADTSYAFHTMKEMGLHVSSGTDCPVELPNPMRGLQCAVTRQPLDGSLPPYRPEEAMTVEEALQAYTAEGAYASFEEAVKGRIQPGQLADFVILSDDPFLLPPQELSRIHVLETFLGGRSVYTRP